MILTIALQIARMIAGSFSGLRSSMRLQQTNYYSDIYLGEYKRYLAILCPILKKWGKN